MKRDYAPTIPASALRGEVREMVNALAHGDFSPALKESLEIGQRDIAGNFAAQGSPTGGPWPPRKDKKKKHPLEILSGMLFQAETSDFGEGHIEEIGPREAFSGVDSGEVPWATTQNLGDPEKNVPARLSEDVDAGAVDKMAEAVAARALELLF